MVHVDAIIGGFGLWGPGRRRRLGGVTPRAPIERSPPCSRCRVPKPERSSWKAILMLGPYMEVPCTPHARDQKPPSSAPGYLHEPETASRPRAPGASIIPAPPTCAGTRPAAPLELLGCTAAAAWGSEGEGFHELSCGEDGGLAGRRVARRHWGVFLDPDGAAGKRWVYISSPAPSLPNTLHLCFLSLYSL